jgi:hypothetical protein
MASIYAYRAYNDSSMLDIAEGVWESLSQYVISESDAAQGSHPSKNSSFSGTCNNSESNSMILSILPLILRVESVAGGLFFVCATYSVEHPY